MEEIGIVLTDRPSSQPLYMKLIRTATVIDSGVWHLSRDKDDSGVTASPNAFSSTTWVPLSSSWPWLRSSRWFAPFPGGIGPGFAIPAPTLPR
jgi:hypothetical protein